MNMDRNRVNRRVMQLTLCQPFTSTVLTRSRFALVFSAAPNPYIALAESQIEAGKRFANKIWNASRLLLMNLDDFQPGRPTDLILCDRWIRSRYNATVETVTTCLEEFRFSDAAHTLYEFLWHEFCDWYVELIKQRLYYTDDPTAKHTAQLVASEILEGTMRMLHPIMPFITEEIWQRLPHEGDSIMVAPWPNPQGNRDRCEGRRSNADNHGRY